jgi:glycosyltransferase involved in cell wall biosynthesis
MDDCSPDNTPEVARSLQDPRVKHIRNNPNLGHLRNYNKGISLSRVKYVWLISADDYLSVMLRSLKKIQTSGMRSAQL